MIKIIKQEVHMRGAVSRVRIGNILRTVICFGVLLSGGTFLMAGTSSAEEMSWLAGTPTLVEDVVYQPYSYGTSQTVRGCIPQDIWIIGQALPQERCIATSGALSIDSRFEYIKIGSDQQYYALYGLGTGLRPTNLYAPGSDKYIMRTGFGSVGHNGYLEIVSNLLQSFTSQINSSGVREYGYNYTPGFVLKDGNGPLAIGKGGSVSNNGRWLVVELVNKGLARIDLENNYKTELFSDMAFSYDSGIYPWLDMAISDDGKYAAVSESRWMQPMVFEINDDCLRDISPDNPLSLEGYQSCPGAFLGTALASVEGYHGAVGLDFGENGHELLVQTGIAYGDQCGGGMTSCGAWRKIRAAGYNPDESRLDYLALGDSYSSGEGDTERRVVLQPMPVLPGGLPTLSTSTYLTNYYRPYTDNEESASLGIPREKCHTSTRSYPYILAGKMALADDRWNTVACSGAVITDATLQGEYRGQKKGDSLEHARLEGYDNYKSLQLMALNEFIPGRIEQIRFIEKYRPGVVTLTMGGNDAKFGDIVNACVNPLAEWTKTCSFAANDDKKASLARQIKEQYSRLIALYKEVAIKSPETKLFVLGYPQFVNDQPSNAQCGLNVRLNNAERTMAREAVSYMNNVVKHAAQSAGAIYIDVESSLDGHQLCDSAEKAVTGITLWREGEKQESFHPNKVGHELIAARVYDAVGNQSLLTYTCYNGSYVACPAQVDEPVVPGYFVPAVVNNVSSENVHLTAGSAIKGVANTLVNILDYTIGANNPLSIMLYSDPVDLGTYVADNSGGFHGTITIPNTVPAGFHTLEITTTTYSGEPIKLWQIIEVQGADPGDRDEDGVLDRQDPCIYIAASDVDDDMDGVDDACDSYIAAKPDLYRVRVGNPTRNYNGQAEKDHTLYVERNIWASGVTRVAGDYDPDSDGWAIVGVSGDSQLINVEVIAEGAVDFEVLGSGMADDPYYPAVYAYSEDGKCMAYRPSSLGIVRPDEFRGLSHAMISNEKCQQDLSGGNPGGSPVDGENPSPSQNEPSPLARLQSAIRAVVNFLEHVIVTVLNRFRSLLSIRN